MITLQRAGESRNLKVLRKRKFTVIYILIRTLNDICIAEADTDFPQDHAQLFKTPVGSGRKLPDCCFLANFAGGVCQDLLVVR